MLPDVSEMTLFDCAKFEADRRGWGLSFDDPGGEIALWDHNGNKHVYDLTFVAAAMPEGWCVHVFMAPGQQPRAEAWRPNAFVATGISCWGDTELIARACLAVACHRSTKKDSPNAK